MTQQEQQEFTESLEAALSWMRAIQERLKANDNTQGPRDALEARLRETEKIQASEHEGRVKMDMALVTAETLLQGEDEELKNHTQAKLKDLKTLWEETCTYIIHCHSRIEWVWLHWSEYLKAYEEFELWLRRQRRGLDVGVELQLGVTEKLWQVEQQRVVLSDVHGQAALLERLLDEAAALHNRTQDPSVEARAQERLQEAYNHLRDGAQERLLLLQKIAEEHQTHRSCVHRFQSWLLSKTKELTDLMEQEETAENRLRSIKALDDSVASEEKTLLHIESMAEAVRSNTSPAGAEAVMEEAEELRLGWQRLRQGFCEAEEGLRSSLDSHSQFGSRCRRLGDDMARLRELLQGLDLQLQEDGEAGGDGGSEEQMVERWRKYMAVRNTLSEEESQVEHLKAQLKDLFRFSEDSHHLSDDVVSVVKEHHSVKCRATRLCSDMEAGLRSVLQDPLLVFTQWSHMVSQVLEASAEVTDSSHIAMLVQNIERLLKDSAQLQERLGLLQVQRELLESVFGPERSDGLQADLSSAIRNRELLHAQLLQRKSRLQGLISRTKDFGDAYESTRSKLAALRERLVSADGLQPDILAKKSQADQFRVIQKDLEDCEAQLTALETLVSSSTTNRTQFERLCAEWKLLDKTARVKVHECERGIGEHECFHDNLLNVEKWLMIMKQKMKSFRKPTGEWSIRQRQHEAERALSEFPEKELQLQQTEAQGQGVLEETSEEGRVHILRDLQRLRESWLTLYNLSLNIHGLLSSSAEQTDSERTRGPAAAEDEEEVQVGRGGQRRGVRAAAGFGSGRPRSLEGEEESLSLWTQGYVEGRVPEEELSAFTPVRTGEEVRSSSGGDEVDSSSRGQSFNDSTAQEERSSQGEDSSRKMEVSLVGSSRGEAGVATGEVLSRGGGGAGRGGAFTVLRKDGSKQQHTAVGTGQSEFELWLSRESERLSGIQSVKGGAALSAKELRTRRDTLKALRSSLPWGQEQFQLLLQERRSSGPADDVSLEELRYHWMLYKSKLKEAGDVRARVSTKKVQAKQQKAAKVQKRPGLLQRACRLALPLWLLLLALLLFSFLLPLMDGGSSCSLSNNFRRSFNLMLSYEGPPPT